MQSQCKCHLGRRTRRQGQQIVEFALVLPLLLALVMGIMEFGYLVKNQLQIANATREGARAAALGKTVSETKTRVQNSASPLVVASNNINIKWSATDGTDDYPYVAGDSGTQNNIPAGRMVRVSTLYVHNSLTGFFPFMNNRNLNIQVTMRREAT